MAHMTRRTATYGLLFAASFMAGCTDLGMNGKERRLDADASFALDELYQKNPEMKEVVAKSSGILIFPSLTELGFGYGGGYGKGVLRVNGSTVDYYSAAKGSFGLQVGAEQYSHVILFMTNESLSNFRQSTGWSLGAGVSYAAIDQGSEIVAETLTAQSEIIAVVFGHEGLKVGGTLEGTKYSLLSR